MSWTQSLLWDYSRCLQRLKFLIHCKHAVHNVHSIFAFGKFETVYHSSQVRCNDLPRTGPDAHISKMAAHGRDGGQVRTVSLVTAVTATLSMCHRLAFDVSPNGNVTSMRTPALRVPTVGVSNLPMRGCSFVLLQAVQEMGRSVETAIDPRHSHRRVWSGR